MINAWWTRGLWLGVAAGAFAWLPAGWCSGHEPGSTHGTGPGASTGTGGGTGLGGGLTTTTNAALLSISISPPLATIDTTGTPMVQAFTATGHYKDGSTADITSAVTWSAPLPQVGSIDNGGHY